MVFFFCFSSIIHYQGTTYFKKIKATSILISLQIKQLKGALVREVLEFREV